MSDHRLIRRLMSAPVVYGSLPSGESGPSVTLGSAGADAIFVMRRKILAQRGGYRHGKRSHEPPVVEYGLDATVSALRWFKEREPVAGLDVSDDFKVFPTTAMRDHLTTIGLIEECPAQRFELIRYRTTEKGRALIEESVPQVTNGEL